MQDCCADRADIAPIDKIIEETKTIVTSKMNDLKKDVWFVRSHALLLYFRF